MIKKITSLIGIILLSLVIISCGVFKETPKSAVNNAIRALKEIDLEKIEQYFGADNFIVKDDLYIDAGDEYLKSLFNNIKHKIVKSSIDGDNAVVEVEITNVDMKSILVECIDKVFKDFVNVRKDDAENRELVDKLDRMVIDTLNQKSNKKINSLITIKLSKDNGSWLIDTDEELIYTIFGGITESLGELQFALDEKDTANDNNSDNGVIDDTDDSNGSRLNSELKRVKDEIGHVGIGDKVSFDDWEYEVLEVGNHRSIGSLDANGQYIVNLIKITNNSEHTRSVGVDFFIAEDNLGNIYDFESTASLEHHHQFRTDTWHLEDIGHSYCAVMPIVFDVDRRASEIYVYPKNINERDYSEIKLIKINLNE